MGEGVWEGWASSYRMNNSQDERYSIGTIVKDDRIVWEEMGSYSVGGKII